MPRRTPGRSSRSDAVGDRGGNERRGHRRRDQGRGRRRGLDHQVPRRAEQRVQQERGQQGVKTGLRRQPGDPGIGHGFGHHETPQRQAGDDVGGQPRALIRRQPVNDRKEPGQEARLRSRDRLSNNGHGAPPSLLLGHHRHSLSGPFPGRRNAATPWPYANSWDLAREVHLLEDPGLLVVLDALVALVAVHAHERREAQVPSGVPDQLAHDLLPALGESPGTSASPASSGACRSLHSACPHRDSQSRSPPGRACRCVRRSQLPLVVKVTFVPSSAITLPSRASM